MGKTDVISIITMGAIGIIAYALFKKKGLLSGITVGSDVIAEKGQQTIEIIRETTPIIIETKVTQEERKLRKAKGKGMRTDIVETEKTRRTGFKEPAKTEKTKSKALRVTLTEQARQTVITSEAVTQKQRFKEYGTTPKEYFKKVFMPTVKVGYERRKAVKDTVTTGLKKFKGLFKKKKLRG